MPPDFSNAERPIGPGFSDSINTFRPGALELMRRRIKLKYDESLLGRELWKDMVVYACTALIISEKRKGNNMRSPLEVAQTRLLARLLLASSSLHRQMTAKQNDERVDIQCRAEGAMRMDNQKPMTVAECYKTIHNIMSKQPDPLLERPL